MAAADKGPGAFRTIGELSQELGVAQHILRYWETKFPQLRPLQRAGNRRYYRPADVDLARKIHRLLSQDGYTVRGVQKLLRGKDGFARNTREHARRRRHNRSRKPSPSGDRRDPPGRLARSACRRARPLTVNPPGGQG